MIYRALTSDFVKYAKKITHLYEIIAERTQRRPVILLILLSTKKKFLNIQKNYTGL